MLVASNRGVNGPSLPDAGTSRAGVLLCGILVCLGLVSAAFADSEDWRPKESDLRLVNGTVVGTSNRIKFILLLGNQYTRELDLTLHLEEFRNDVQEWRWLDDGTNPGAPETAHTDIPPGGSAEIVLWTAPRPAFCERYRVSARAVLKYEAELHTFEWIFMEVYAGNLTRVPETHLLGASLALGLVILIAEGKGRKH